MTAGRSSLTFESYHRSATTCAGDRGGAFDLSATFRQRRGAPGAETSQIRSEWRFISPCRGEDGISSCMMPISQEVRALLESVE
jgi:hypothetical protein